MTVDEITKIMLISAICFAIVGIAYELMRVLGKIADSIQDIRPALQNASKVSTQMTEDYLAFSRLLNSILSKIEEIKAGILDPLMLVGKVFGAFSGSSKKDKKPENDS